MFLKLGAALLSVIWFSACGQGNLELGREKKEVLKVIYGEDDRREFFDSNTNDEIKIAKATAGVFLKKDLLEIEDFYQINRKSLGETYGLCSSERFYYQQLGPRCTGILVSEDLLLTAGHCVADADFCKKELSFNFSYHLNGSDQPISSIAKNETYSCKKLIYHSQNFQEDFALVQLNKPVKGVEPVTKFKNNAFGIAEGGLSMVGHPLGLPKKIVRGGSIRSTQNFAAIIEIDAFSGNSGSPVFDASTGALLGLLSKGESDIVEGDACNKIRRCKEGECLGELIYYLDDISKIIAEYNENKAPMGGPTRPRRPLIYSSFYKKEIPDGNFMGVISELKLSEAPAGRKVYIGVSIEHNWIGDLRISVIPPGGKELLLRNQEAWSSSKLEGLFGINLVSATSMSSLEDIHDPGIWRLKVIDIRKGDSGAILNWRVIIQ